MIDVLLTPADITRAESLFPASQVVILDVLRATSTIAASLSAEAREVRLFDSLDAARTARSAWTPSAGPALLAGEQSCLKPDDFDLGNSPREHAAAIVAGATVLLATTNGTRAAVRADTAQRLLAGSLLNATATAKALMPALDRQHTFLLCAGTNGALALEDVIGAGAILFGLLQSTYRTDLAFTDSAWLAYHTFAAVRTRLAAALRLGAGGINVINAGLEEDIDVCARLDALPIVIDIHRNPLRAARTS
jgi:2-phosphosulfolactate phosphatase